MPETTETKRHEAMIERRCASFGFTIQGWYTDPDDDRIAADLGQAQVIEDDENTGMYVGDQGKLTASVVGAEQYGNERVSFMFTNNDFEPGNGNEVSDPLEYLELI